MTLLSDWGMARMMIELVPEVNRAFSAWVTATIAFLGRCPQAEKRPRLWRWLDEFCRGVCVKRLIKHSVLDTSTATTPLLVYPSA